MQRMYEQLDTFGKSERLESKTYDQRTKYEKVAWHTGSQRTFFLNNTFGEKIALKIYAGTDTLK